MRANDILPLFAAGGIHFPDFLVFSSDLWRDGEGAILATGLFANDWSINPEESVRQEESVR